MINPLIDSLDHFTLQELEDKIAELQRKYFISRNPQVQVQIALVQKLTHRYTAGRITSERAATQLQDAKPLGIQLGLNRPHVVRVQHAAIGQATRPHDGWAVAYSSCCRAAWS